MNRPILLASLALGAAAVAVGAWLILGQAGSLHVSPEDVDFGRVAVGDQVRQVLIASNTGREPIVVSRIATDAPFTVSRTDLELAPGESAEILVNFLPEASGDASGRLRLESGALSGGAFEISLAGHGHRPPQVALAPLFVAFGAVEVGSAGTALIAVTNDGEAELRLENISTGIPFSTQGPEAVVPPGGSLDLPLRFEPKQVGDFQQTLQIRTNDPRRETLNVQMTGSGVASAPLADLEVSPTSLTFDGAGCEPQERSIVLRNAGQDPLALATLAIPAPFFGPVRSRTLDPGDEIELEITFAPNVLGSRKASLAIHSNDPAERVVNVALDAGVSSCVATHSAAQGAAEMAARRAERSAGESLAGGSGASGTAAGADSGGLLDPTAPGLGQDDTAGTEGDGDGDADDPTLPTVQPSIEDGSSVRVGSYGSDISSVDVGAIEYDSATGRIALRDFRLPPIEAALGEYFQFNVSDAVGRFNSDGEVDLVLDPEMVDGWGNPTPMKLTLTTGETSTLVEGRQFIAMNGRPKSRSGNTQLVGLATFPPGSPFEGQAMRIVINVKVH